MDAHSIAVQALGQMRVAPRMPPRRVVRERFEPAVEASLEARGVTA